MFSEYAAVVGADIRNWWTGQILPILDMVSDLPYFWPGVVAVTLAFIMTIRKIVR